MTHMSISPYIFIYYVHIYALEVHRVDIIERDLQKWESGIKSTCMKNK